MATVAQPFRCDACGKLRETDANHWFILWQTPPVVPVVDRTLGLMLMPWREDAAREPRVRHACGVACALKLTSSFLAEGHLPTAEPPDPRMMLEK